MTALEHLIQAETLFTAEATQATDPALRVAAGNDARAVSTLIDDLQNGKNQE